VRDSLVEEFRSTYGKSRQWGLRDLSQHVVAFCQDQHGSRFIQQRLEVCSDVDKQLIFDEIIPSAQSLMTDVFGNYVLQKLFEYGTPDQCEALALLLKGQSVQLAMQMYGCRVVQKALEYVSTTRLIDLVTEFENPQLLLRCVHDSNGNHVIQKCIEIVSKVAKEAPNTEMSDFLSGRIQFIIAAFQGRVKELSSHPYGCRVVQRILEHCSNNQKAVVLEELRQCCTDLVQDCYGNYVIQFVMQHGWEADRAILIREVQSNLLDFSQHKFASNVVEKCLQYANKKDRDEMIWTIINVTFDLKSPVDAKGHCVLESMVRDPYANYVVQKVIDVSDERQRAAIMRYVKENITQLRRYTYGKHIIVRLEKITNEKF
jgi:pumilio RNA-binding family